MNYTIKNEYLIVCASDEGAELKSIRSADGTEYLWQPDPKYWTEQAPNIFPYVARLTDGKYTLNGRTYDMKIHGMIKYLTLSVQEHTQTSITFRLDSDQETKKQYPFDFTYSITYSLRENRLMTSSRVENLGVERMYFGIGGHPGFRVPLDEGLEFEDYFLEFGKESHPWRVGFTDACYLTGADQFYPLESGKRIPLKHELFDHDAIVLKHADRSVKIGSDRGTRSVTVTYPQFQYIGFWHMPKTDAPYVCVEPWSSLPSRDGIVEDFSQQSDLIRLDAGKTYENTWEIEIR